MVKTQHSPFPRILPFALGLVALASCVDPFHPATQPVPAPIYDPEPLIFPDPFEPANFPPAFPITCGGPDRAGMVCRCSPTHVAG